MFPRWRSSRTLEGQKLAACPDNNKESFVEGEYMELKMREDAEERPCDETMSGEPAGPGPAVGAAVDTEGN